MKSLEEICFTHLLTTLEQYPVEVLALLPKAMRSEMLHSLPIVDVCRLEDTQFTAGIDMDAVWKDLYITHLQPNSLPQSPQQESWREKYLSAIFREILKDNRPYGYSWYHILSDADRPVPDNTPNEHSVDIVNYLVTAKRPPDFATVPDQTHAHNPARRENLVPSRHQVTLLRGVVPPGPLYDRACQEEQVLPPRYRRCCLGSSRFLLDSVALDLLREQCHFSCKDLSISTPEFSTLLQHVEHSSRNDAGLLASLFKEVECLTICEGKAMTLQDFRMRLVTSVPASVYALLTAYPDCNEVWEREMKSETEKVPAKILRSVLSSADPKLTGLTLNVAERDDDITSSIAPLLTSYNGLTTFSICVKNTCKVYPDFGKLLSITENQPKLHTVSISVMNCDQSPVPHGPLQSWIQACSLKSSLNRLNLSLESVPVRALLQILFAFLSAPCLHHQTLALRHIRLSDNSTDATSEAAPDHAQDMALEPRSLDGVHTLPHKSLIFDHCYFRSSRFTSLLFGLQPLKLRELVIIEGSLVLSTLLHPGFDLHSLKIRAMNMSRTAPRDYTGLLQKKSLKELMLAHCSFVEPVKIHEVAQLEEFRLDEQLRQTSSRTTSYDYTYTLTRA